MKIIPVKIGWELIFILILILFVPFKESFTHPNWKGSLVLAGVVLFIVYMIFSIRYSVSNDFLYVKNGIFGTTKINIHDISRVEKTWNPLSSPAPAIIGRVEIVWKGGNSIIISPKNYEEFQRLLQSINPGIVFKDA